MLINPLQINSNENFQQFSAKIYIFAFANCQGCNFYNYAENTCRFFLNKLRSGAFRVYSP